MHVLIAPNAFKNSLHAADAAEAIQTGLMQSKLKCTTECFPIGDGGDGTAELIIKRCGGTFEIVEVHDATGRMTEAAYGLIDNGTTAVIEMANASGLRLLKDVVPNPIHATSFGTGELIKQALNKGVSKIIIAMGGSATVDGGAGILSALGVRFLNAKGEVLHKMPEMLINLDSINFSDIDKNVPKCSFSILCDVDNNLLGENGSAAAFGPQKGASAEDVQLLEKCLEKFAKITFKQTGKDLTKLKFGGTAGGAAAGLFAFLDAELVNGIDYFLQLTNFKEALDKSDIVITGEGSIDEQTLQGKGPFGVALQARKKGIKVIGLAGKIALKQELDVQQYFDVLLSIGNEPGAIQTAIENTKDNLIRTAKQVGNLLAF